MDESPREECPLREVMGRLRDDADTVLSQFYERLLSRRPDFARLFDGTDWSRQRRMLLNALVLAIEAEEEPGVAEETLRGYGRRHHPFSLSEDDYVEFGETLRETLSETVGDCWTPQMDAVWTRAYDKLVRAMRR